MKRHTSAPHEVARPGPRPRRAPRTSPSRLLHRVEAGVERRRRRRSSSPGPGRCVACARDRERPRWLLLEAEPRVESGCVGAEAAQVGSVATGGPPRSAVTGRVMATGELGAGLRGSGHERDHGRIRSEVPSARGAGQSSGSWRAAASALGARPHRPGVGARRCAGGPSSRSTVPARSPGRAGVPHRCHRAPAGPGGRCLRGWPRARAAVAQGGDRGRRRGRRRSGGAGAECGRRLRWSCRPACGAGPGPGHGRRSCRRSRGGWVRSCVAGDS